MGCSVSRSSGGETNQPQTKPHTLLRSLQAENLPRFAACSVLYKAGIPVCIWLEDALAQLGVPTLVFDLFLLVRSGSGFDKGGIPSQRTESRHLGHLAIQ